jgi:MoaA/NifB/PqqE/SkfB family radical SAM enzyme
LSAPCEVAIELTGRCNLNCKYCFSERTDKQIPLTKVEDILNQVDEMGVFEVCFSGGEPFLRKDIFDILNYSLKKNFDLSIVTNGSLLTIQTINKLNDLGLINSLQISIDSSNEKIHNSVRGMFSETMNSLKEMKKISSERPIIGLVIHKQNYKDICN